MACQAERSPPAEALGEGWVEGGMGTLYEAEQKLRSPRPIRRSIIKPLTAAVAYMLWRARPSVARPPKPLAKAGSRGAWGLCMKPSKSSAHPDLSAEALLNRSPPPSHICYGVPGRA